MSQPVLLDTGPLVAFLNSADPFHPWAEATFHQSPAPLLTCEAVLTEAAHLVRRVPQGIERVLGLLETGAVALALDLTTEQRAVRQLVSRYSSVPMSLADACLVRMSELVADSSVLTLDSDFQIYRRNGRQVIPLLMPPER